MKRIFVKSRAAMELGYWVPDAPYSVISITDPGSDPVWVFNWPKTPRHPRMLLMQFHDFDPVQYGDGPKPWQKWVMDTGRMGTYRECAMQSIHARELIKFAKERLDAGDLLYIHCEAGVSRSPSAACAIADALGIPRDQIDFGIGGEAGQPLNQHVYQLIMEEWSAAEKNQQDQVQHVPDGDREPAQA